MRKMVIGVALLGALLIAIPAMAQTEGQITIHLEGVVTGSPGDVVALHSEPVPENLIGATCTGFAESQNNESQHVGNDFILSSGTTHGVIPNWEAVAGATTPMSGSLVLGATVDVFLQLGGTVSSGGVLIVLNCAQPPPVTEPPVTEPPVTEPPVTEPPVTEPPVTEPPVTQPPGTTVPPPEGGVAAGGGATAGSGFQAAVLWLTGGAAALLGGATLLAMRRATGRE